MNILLVRHGRNTYVDEGSLVAGELGTAGKKYAQDLVRYPKVKDILPLIKHIYAWSGLRQGSFSARCIDTVSALVQRTNCKMSTYHSPGECADKLKELKGQKTHEWAVFCVCSQDLKSLGDLLPDSEEFLNDAPTDERKLENYIGGYERFVTYENQNSYQPDGQWSTNYTRVEVYWFGMNEVYTKPEMMTIQTNPSKDVVHPMKLNLGSLKPPKPNLPQPDHFAPFPKPPGSK
jgi:hypothetical protein